MPGMRILAVDAVAVNGNVGQAMIRRKSEIVRVSRDLNRGLLFERQWIEESQVRAELVHHEQALGAGRMVQLHPGPEQQASAEQQKRRGSDLDSRKRCLAHKIFTPEKQLRVRPSLPGTAK